MVRTGTTSQEMVQFINALVQENAKKEMWIGSLMREEQAQAQILQQHQQGQQRVVQGMKWMMQPQQQQEHHPSQQPIITDSDEEGQDVQRGPIFTHETSRQRREWNDDAPTATTHGNGESVLREEKETKREKRKRRE